MKLVTSQQMRDLETAAVAAGVSLDQLMEEAGLAGAQEAMVSTGIMEGRIFLVLVGPGNNGGDGLVAARHLQEWDAEPHVYLLQPRAEDDRQWRALLEAGVPWTLASEDPGFARLDELLAQSGCVIDALLGTGVARPIAGDLATILARVGAAQHRRALKPKVIALDLPSGVDPDTGHADPLTLEADYTIAFGQIKVGLFMLPARLLSGEVVRVDIGIPQEYGDALPYEELALRLLQPEVPARAADAHKGAFGHAMIAAGSPRYPGAARLAAEAAARSGCGLTTLAAPRDIQALLVHGLPDVTHEPLPSTEGRLDEAAARVLLRALPGIDALLVGPGLDHTRDTEAFVRALLAGLDAVDHGPHAVVLDADALNALAAMPGWHERLALPRVLTPHPGEMGRLLGISAEAVQADRLEAATRYARETHSVVILKGACTIVAAPDGRARLTGAAVPMLAHGGTGDVLAGLVTGLLALGLGPYEAASAAVWVHTECGKEVERAFGSAAGIAQDLLRALPGIRRQLDAAD